MGLRFSQPLTLTRADGTWEKLYIVDASTVVLSLGLSSLNAAKVILATRRGRVRARVKVRVRP